MYMWRELGAVVVVVMMLMNDVDVDVRCMHMQAGAVRRWCLPFYVKLRGQIIRSNLALPALDRLVAGC